MPVLWLDDSVHGGGWGHWSAALTANPVTVVAALVFLIAPLLAIDPIRSLLRVPPRVLWIVGSVLMAGSWIWELHRFGFLT